MISIDHPCHHALEMVSQWDGRRVWDRRGGRGGRANLPGGGRRDRAPDSPEQESGGTVTHVNGIREAVGIPSADVVKVIAPAMVPFTSMRPPPWTRIRRGQREGAGCNARG